MNRMLCLFIAVVFTACVSPEHNARVLAYEQHMKPEWIKENIHIGKTTQDEIYSFYGKPFQRITSMTSGAAAAYMPEEMWTYSVQFTEADKYGVSRRFRSVVFSFKGGSVSAVNTSGIE